MSQDRENEFRVQIAKRKASGVRRVRVKCPQSFLDSLAPRRGRRSSINRARPSRTVQRSFHRRVIVQASIKRMAGTGAAKLKDHLSYLERDATQKDASPGKLYGSLINDVDADSSHTRCKGDRHHFRFVVSPEDAEQMANLKAYTRELVSPYGKRHRNEARLDYCEKRIRHSINRTDFSFYEQFVFSLSALVIAVFMVNRTLS